MHSTVALRGRVGQEAELAEEVAVGQGAQVDAVGLGVLPVGERVARRSRVERIADRRAFGRGRRLELDLHAHAVGGLVLGRQGEAPVRGARAAVHDEATGPHREERVAVVTLLHDAAANPDPAHVGGQHQAGKVLGPEATEERRRVEHVGDVLLVEAAGAVDRLEQGVEAVGVGLVEVGGEVVPVVAAKLGQLHEIALEGGLLHESPGPAQRADGLDQHALVGEHRGRGAQRGQRGPGVLELDVALSDLHHGP